VRERLDRHPRPGARRSKRHTYGMPRLPVCHRSRAGNRTSMATVTWHAAGRRAAA
jgi:hypothetical protein